MFRGHDVTIVGGGGGGGGGRVMTDAGGGGPPLQAKARSHRHGKWSENTFPVGRGTQSQTWEMV